MRHLMDVVAAVFGFIAVTAAFGFVEGHACGPIPLDRRSEVDRWVVAPYVEVRTEGGGGSGVVVRQGKRVFVVTAKHVAPCDGEYSVRKERGDRTTEWRTKWLRAHEKADVALLEPVDPRGLSAASINDKLKLKAGEDCYYIGTGGKLHASLKRSVVNRPWYRDEYGRVWALVNGGAWFGDSGGPVYVKRDERWVLAGLIAGAQQDPFRNPRAPTRIERLVNVLELLKAEKRAAK
jgi:hypothetical protein